MTLLTGFRMLFFAFLFSFVSCAHLTQMQVQRIRASYVPLKVPCAHGRCEVKGVMVPKDVNVQYGRIIDLNETSVGLSLFPRYAKRSHFSVKGKELPAMISSISYAEKSEDIHDAILIRYIDGQPLLACRFMLSRKTFSTINSIEIIKQKNGQKSIQYAQTSRPKSGGFFLAILRGGSYRPGPPVSFHHALNTDGFCAGYGPKH